MFNWNSQPLAPKHTASEVKWSEVKWRWKFQIFALADPAEDANEVGRKLNNM